MKFNQYLEIFGSFNYEVPEDKEQQLFDFYMLNNLRGRSSYDNKIAQNVASSGLLLTAPKSRETGEMDNEDKIDYMLKEVSKKLLPTLKKNLLSAVFFSICAEIRHVLSVYDPNEKNFFKGTNNKNYFKDLIGNDLLYDIFKKYIEYLILFKSDHYLMVNPEKHPDAQQQRPDYEKSNTGYLISYQAFKHTGATKPEFVRLAYILYKKAKWPTSYGGPAWAEIAKSWLDLEASNTESNLVVQIDHVYDLQHNTSTVFNKLHSYLKSDSYDWILKALDLKANIKNPYELINKVSPAMKKLAQRAIWVKTGVTQEKFEQERQEYEKNKDKQIDTWAQSIHDKADTSHYDDYNDDDDEEEDENYIYFYNSLVRSKKDDDDPEKYEYKLIINNKKTWVNENIFKIHLEDNIKFQKKRLYERTSQFSECTNLRAIVRAITAHDGNIISPSWNDLGDGLGNFPSIVFCDVLGIPHISNLTDFFLTTVVTSLYKYKKAAIEDAAEVEKEFLHILNSAPDKFSYIKGYINKAADALRKEVSSDPIYNALYNSAYSGLLDNFFTEAKSLINQNKDNKISTIKALRIMSGLGLKHTKLITEFLIAKEISENSALREELRDKYKNEDKEKESANTLQKSYTQGKYTYSEGGNVRKLITAGSYAEPEFQLNGQWVSHKDFLNQLNSALQKEQKHIELTYSNIIINYTKPLMAMAALCFSAGREKQINHTFNTNVAAFSGYSLEFLSKILGIHDTLKKHTYASAVVIPLLQQPAVVPTFLVMLNEMGKFVDFLNLKILDVDDKYNKLMRSYDIETQLISTPTSKEDEAAKKKILAKYAIENKSYFFMAFNNDFKNKLNYFIINNYNAKGLSNEQKRLEVVQYVAKETGFTIRESKVISSFAIICVMLGIKL